MRNMFHWRNALVLLVGTSVVIWTNGTFGGIGQDVGMLARTPSGPPPAGSQQVTLGAGCFWSTQVMFQQLRGVHSAVAGYSGGATKNPSYEQVCAGATGHAETVQITFDPKVISLSELLDVYWRIHDPTTLNRQGNDEGPQYRSVIFYHTAEQKELAEQSRQTLGDSRAVRSPIVTEIVPFSEFYPAEPYHQNYYVDHASQRYCALVIRPKLEKFEKLFKDKLKSPASK
jgi:peptide-methionine (S)-S-oxide reductase